LAGRELVREVTYQDRQLVTLRCFYDESGETVVEADVSPVSGGAQQRKPYRFANAHEAFRFMQEAVLVLQYLGCSVTSAS
jgi:hypothetical protein